MNLVREHWNKQDIPEFQAYLKSFGKGEEKAKWEKRIINTKMPCIAIPSHEVGRITKEIAKGNFMEFLDLWIWENFTNTSINGGLICRIKDFKNFEKYLTKYAQKSDNWATCDLLKFKITDKNKEDYFNLASRFSKSPKPFVRRIGITILFKLVDDNNFIYRIFENLNSFKNETEYYVNMVNAWLVAECFIKQREKTLKIFKNHELNKFTINKAISKCRDSFRVSREDKEMLLKYRIK